MKLGLLGDHPSLKRWVSLMTSGGRHQIRCAAGVKELDALLPPQVERLPTPNALLEVTGLDAVLVCGSQERNLQVARQLASQHVPLIILPASDQGSAFLYELSLIRDDRQVPLSPLFPLRRHPLVNRMREILDEDQLGEILQLTLERRVIPDSGPRLKIAGANQHLLWDVDLFWQLSGKYSQVTALRSGELDAAVAAQSVTLSADRLPEAVWTVMPGEQEHWQLTVRGERQQAALMGGPDHELLQLRLGDSNETVSGEEVDEAFLEELDSIEAAFHDPRLQGDWTEFVHAMELVEATGQSIRRRRTVDLYFDLTSERSQFKTQMAALGCGILMLTLTLVILVLILGQALNLSPRAMAWARILAFAPLFLYLALQLLIVLTRPSVSDAPARPPVSKNPDSSSVGSP